MMKLQYIIEKQSKIGGRRENQDTCDYKETDHGLLAVVCDGMGGAKGGKTASTIAVSTIFEMVEKSKQQSAAALLTEAIQAANSAVYNVGQNNSELRGMGTTVVALLINGNKATAAHVGDSRIYQVRDGKKVFRTFDHSMVFELVKRGRLTEEQARLSAESNVILRALGISESVEIEISEDIPYLKKDRFLLCSDGICGAVNEEQMCQLIKYKPSVIETMDNMAETIDKIGAAKSGKHDNLTGILIQVNTKSKIDIKMNNKAKIIILTLLILFVLSIAANIFLASKSEICAEYTASNIEDRVKNIVTQDNSNQ